jgi:NADPH:quinone reductase-like Zn-dependent oxidoreductase
MGARRYSAHRTYRAKGEKLKAVQIDKYGGTEVLVLREVAAPVAADHELLVDIHATSVNPGDIKVRKGLRPAFVRGFPHTLGRDFSGVVRTVGARVAGFKPGDEVFGILELGREGTYAEAVAIDAALVAHKPASLTHAHAVAVALTGLTALYSLEDAAQLRSGETLLIHGGSGGIGTFSIQYAKHVGARIFTTASARKHDYVLGLGAEKAIDYAAEDFVSLVPPCDVVFDMVGGEVQRRSVSVLKPGGRLVVISPSTKDAEGVRNDITILRPVVSRDRKHLERIAELVSGGGVRPPVITHMTLAEAGKAHALIESGRLMGKIVFDVR